MAVFNNKIKCEIDRISAVCPATPVRFLAIVVSAEKTRDLYMHILDRKHPV